MRIEEQRRWILAYPACGKFAGFLRAYKKAQLGSLINTPQCKIHRGVTGSIQVPQFIHDQEPVALGAALPAQLIAHRSDLAMLDGHTTLKQRVP